MKFSLITPTHDLKYILELYQSIKNQTYQNWEWVIYLNSGVFKFNLPQEILNDPRVSAHNGYVENDKIGLIKNKAFNLGTGEVLVELDHDDLLTPDCLQELFEAFKDNEIGFVYSDNAILSDNYQPYNSEYGWTYRDYEFDGKRLVAHNWFFPSSHSLSYIWFAPDHIRAWRASVYKEIGGHDKNYEICDDHELLVRTYLHTKMKHIPKVLYIYRIHGENSWLKKNELIGPATKDIYNIYIQLLAERDADLNGKLKIDLGGGLFPKEGYTTIDKEGGHINCDLNNGIPLDDNSVGVIIAPHIIQNIYDRMYIMKEIHRVLHHGGWAFIDVPSTDGRGAWQDPTHVSYWNENSFWYYTRQEQAKYIRNEEVKFCEFKLETNWWDNNIAVVNVHMYAIKSGYRYPGCIKI